MLTENEMLRVKLVASVSTYEDENGLQIEAITPALDKMGLAVMFYDGHITLMDEFGSIHEVFADFEVAYEFLVNSDTFEPTFQNGFDMNVPVNLGRY